jgi:hypothetical protein
MAPRILFEAAQVLGICVEHNFPTPGPRTIAIYRTMSSGIISIEPATCFHVEDRPHVQFIQWTRWAIRMLFLHLPARIYVLSGDASTHDVHHYKQGANISNFEMEQIKLIVQGYPLYSTWGLIPAIDQFFALLSIQPRGLFACHQEN